jgi:hypothetical protein
MEYTSMGFGYWVRAVASLGATAPGALLLLADSADDDSDQPACETYGAYQRSYDYSNGCPSGSSTGRIVFGWGESGDSSSSSTAAKAQLSQGGLAASFVAVDYSRACRDAAVGSGPEDIRFVFGGERGDEYRCGALHLNLAAPEAVTCTWQGDAGVSEPAACMITFTPAE